MILIKNQIDKTENETFDNEQMLLHFGDISDEIDLNVSEGIIIIDEDLVVIYKSLNIPVDAKIIKFAYVYKKLEKTYRLEAKTLMEVLFKRGAFINFSELDLINILTEVRKQHKLQTEKAPFTSKIVWLKNQDGNNI
ncbi:hypothetical protein IWX84_000206 [Flavobacterium sp. CG_9.10]|uniref:hypothetical protein n=1 Tax=Flavobacterium sp. CG_9.10 TaxID=2787729 RepID=UPI0018C90238|nr:hypothetical protein [Flavobacterium sp. CG_9.10]MBG6109351.1 hypothetical protein [Flavobacterium sp. CG_9.10]